MLVTTRIDEEGNTARVITENIASEIEHRNRAQEMEHRKRDIPPAGCPPQSRGWANLQDADHVERHKRMNRQEPQASPSAVTQAVSAPVSVRVRVLSCWISHSSAARLGVAL
jgi:hypothetical protein